MPSPKSLGGRPRAALGWPNSTRSIRTPTRCLHHLTPRSTGWGNQYTPMNRPLRGGPNTDFTSRVRLNLFFVTVHETCSTPSPKSLGSHPRTCLGMTQPHAKHTNTCSLPPPLDAKDIPSPTGAATANIGVPAKGLEPSRARHRNLNPACLPIPPRRSAGASLPGVEVLF